MNTLTNTSLPPPKPAAAPASSSPPLPQNLPLAQAKEPALNLKVELLAEGLTNTPQACNRVAEWAVNQVTSDIMGTFVPVLDKQGKVVNQRRLTPGEMLDLLTGAKSGLPGVAMTRPATQLVVTRPAARPVMGSDKNVSSCRPARARVTQLLGVLGLNNKKNLARFLAWALTTGFEQFLQLPENLRKGILSGKSVHPDSVLR